MAIAFLAALAPQGASAQSNQLPAPVPLLPSAAAATRPATTTGRLLIRAVQQTADAPKPSRNEAAIHFRGSGPQLSPMAIYLDEQGTAVVNGIPLSRTPVKPIVVVEHAGIRYQAAGEPLDLAHPERTIDVPVYELTDRMPEWRMPARRVTVERAAGGLRIVEVMAVENPADRTWISSPDIAGQRPTFAIALPSGARDLQFGGDFSSEQTRFDGSMLRHSAPLVPGITRYEVGYILPAVGAQVTLPITAPAALRELNVLIADNTAVVASSGLEPKGMVDVGAQKAAQFSAAELKPGQVVSVTLATGAVAPPVAANDDGPSVLPEVFAGVVVVGLLVLGAVVMFLKSTRPTANPRRDCVCNKDH